LDIDAADEEARDRMKVGERLPGREAIFEAHVGIDYRLMHFGGKQQRDVDIDPSGRQLANSD
jgi:hypothetical protein